MAKSKEPVRLRMRKMPSGLTSLYLDIYLDGRRSYEYLKLYLVPEVSRSDREKNRSTLRLAEDIRAKRMVELRNGEFGFKSRRDGDVLFYPYFRSICTSRESRSNGTSGVWDSCLRHLVSYDGDERLTFRDVTVEWVRGFRDYLVSGAEAHDGGRLSHNTQLTYWCKLVACLNRARRDGIIDRNPASSVEGFKLEESVRTYLTLEELRRLASTECRSPVIRRAFLFSCLTGLRLSDVQRLAWGDVVRQGEFVRLIFRQKKTGGQEYLDISPQAVELMGDGGDSRGLVFAGLPTKRTVGHVLDVWVAKAGIDKRVTFHCARHTFAVMMLDLGTDIYTVSKLLGHRSVATTQIYAKVLDKNKQAAVLRIPALPGLSGSGV